MLTPDQKKQDCCGCMACSFACPKSAIQMKTDDCGFAYPEIDQELCVHCGLCARVCPLQENYTGADAIPDIYALQNHAKNIVSESSSGGMFSLLADWTLEQGGVIYGVAFDEGFEVRHMRADSAQSAATFRTSKYVQSDPSQIYQSICTDLKNGLTVLLTGTPCQIAGVTRFLEAKHADTATLYTCDNICHGVPSPGVWKDYLKILESRYMDTDAQITSINMRSKRVSWKKQVMDVSVSKGNLLPVLEEGRKLFAAVRENAVCQPVSKAVGWQPHLEYSTKAPGNQEAFWTEYNAAADLETKEALLRKYMKGSTLTRIIRKVNPILQKTGLYSVAGKMYKAVFVKK